MDQLQVYVDGDAAFSALLTRIDAATKRVWIETYIFTPDILGKRVLDALTRAAARHIDVVLLCDGLGSSALTSDHLAPLRQAGGTVIVYNPVDAGSLWARLFSRFQRRLPLLMRDHRKIWLVDDVGFTGGMNIACEYGGKTLGTSTFRDTHVELGGEPVASLERLFLDSVAEAKGTRRRMTKALKVQGSVRILGSQQRRRQHDIQRELYRRIAGAQKTVWLTTPYFVPPHKLLTMLCAAARKKVDVRVLTAGVSDVPIAKLAAEHFYDVLLSSGVRIFELTAQTLHAKTSTVDSAWSSIGSFNLDRFSFQRNLEVIASIDHVEVAATLEKQFHLDASRGVEVLIDCSRSRSQVSMTERSTLRRVAGWFAYQFARL
jgi:cardiolipin synthase A/B